MEKDTNIFQMVLFIKDSSNKELSMVEEYFNGQMDRFMMDSGKMGTKLEVECGPIFKDKVIWVNGKMIKFKVLESF